jgi:hypothetical protein
MRTDATHGHIFSTAAKSACVALSAGTLDSQRRRETNALSNT